MYFEGTEMNSRMNEIISKVKIKIDKTRYKMEYKSK